MPLTAYLDNCKLSSVQSGITNAAQLQRWSFQVTYYLLQAFSAPYKNKKTSQVGSLSDSQTTPDRVLLTIKRVACFCLAPIWKGLVTLSGVIGIQSFSTPYRNKKT